MGDEGVLFSQIPKLFERVSFGLPFAYSLYGELFLISSKMATDLLENFKSKKNLLSELIFSISSYFISDHIADLIECNIVLIVHVHVLKLVSKQFCWFR